ncbi:MAG: ABC transporter permease [Dehalococcoidales bacterium]|nr:ABC transporter permease [Dehalococcoidales bacterium]
MSSQFKYTIEKRKDIGFLLNSLSIVIALIASIAFAAGLIALFGAEVDIVLKAIARGSFGSLHAIIDTLIKATPIMLTGLATIVAFRAKVWNIGQEGQLYAGSMGATFVILTFPDLNLPAVIHIPLLLLASMIGGALWGGIPGLLKSRYNVNEIIVTVMLNYVVQYLCTFLLNGVWQEPGSYYYNTIRFPQSTFLPLLFNTRLHLGFIIALLAALLVYFLIWKMKLGFEIRARGDNPVAASYKGINTKRVTLLVMLLSGAISGLAGGVEVLGIHHKLIWGFSSGFGFTGILIALLGRLHPVGVIVASIFFGALHNGASAMQIYSDVPRSLVNLIMGLIIVMLLFWEAVFKYRLRRVENVS